MKPSEYKDLLRNDILKDDLSHIEICESRSDYEKVIGILVETFAASRDQAVVWLTGPHLPSETDEEYEKRIMKSAEFLHRWCNNPIFEKGVILVVRDPAEPKEIVGAATLAVPGYWHQGWWDTLKNLFTVGFPLSSRLFQMDVLKKPINKILEKYKEIWYLQTLGVRSVMKGKGTGSQLLNAICKVVDATKMPIFLDTESERLVKYYQRYGFETVDEVEVSTQEVTVKVWYLVREARTD